MKEPIAQLGIFFSYHGKYGERKLVVRITRGQVAGKAHVLEDAARAVGAAENEDVQGPRLYGEIVMSMQGVKDGEN
jgi:hypothetical protein